MIELEFCRQHCHDIAKIQEILIQTHVEKGTFWGVGRPFGCRAFMPVVFWETGYFAIDSQGSFRPVSTVSMIKFEK